MPSPLCVGADAFSTGSDGVPPSLCVVPGRLINANTLEDFKEWDKAALLHTANRKIEMLRWLVRMAKDQALFTARQYEFSCERLEECGRMTGGWLKSCSRAH